jgi:hypothetical protein
MAANSYRVSEMVNLPDAPGLYAWYFVFNPAVDHADYHTVFKNKEVHTTVRGHLKEEYEGILKANVVSFEKSPITDFEALAACSELFSPPIYIGIAKKSLKTRLPQHVDKLKRLLYSRFPVEDLEESEEMDEAEGDENSDEVSLNIFANRIFKAVSGIKSVGLNSFLVKTMQFETDYSPSQISAIEKFLNRTYVPIYGRR